MWREARNAFLRGGGETRDVDRDALGSTEAGDDVGFGLHFFSHRVWHHQNGDYLRLAYLS